LPENFYFGGGAVASTIHPVVLWATLLAALSLLTLPRKYALLPSLAVLFLIPQGQEVFVDGFHVYAVRIIIIAGLIRLAWIKLSGPYHVFSHGLQLIDKMFLTWVILHAFTFVLVFRDTGAVTFQLGVLLNACGYLLFRYFIQDRGDALLVTKTLVLVSTVLAVCMGYEYLSGVNVFSYINDSTIIPWTRDGRVRAQGIFANSITAGAFGATLFPISFWLLRSGKNKFLGVVGPVASSVIAATSMASTGIMAYGAGILALCLWPIRKYMRTLRWGIMLTVIGLTLAMRAPVWFIIARVDFVGGHAWDRATLIDATVRHFSDWWLIGTKSNASWGSDTWDACNQFVYEATSGGLITLVVFVAILSRAFSMIGKARKRAEGSRRQEWFYWCLGAALYAHVMSFWGIDYFDVIRTWWYIFLAMIPAATVVARVSTATEAKAALVFDETLAVPDSERPEAIPRHEQSAVSLSSRLFS
jgi:hypothetical protein